MGDNKVLEMFDSIPQFDTFSKYSSSLQRIFKHSSFKNLLQELKSPKKFNEYEKENKKNEHGKFFTDNISNLEDQMLMKIKNDENEDFFDEKYDGKNIKKIKSPKVNKQETFFQKKKSNLPERPDPYKYHPNYNAIYRNIPSVKFIKPLNYISPLKKKEEKIRSESLEKKTEKKIKMPKINQSILITNLHTENNNNNKLNENNNYSTNLTTNNINNNNENNSEEKKKKKAKIILPSISKTNHALRFSKYTFRKFKIPKQLDKLTYLEPINYLENINKISDFNKMSSRSEIDLLNNPSSLDNPSFNNYQPKYDYVEKNAPMISFSRNKDENKKDKKFLLRKLWGSYNFTTEYQLVDNDKLGDYPEKN